MRILRYPALLLIAVSAFASDKPSDTTNLNLQPKLEGKMLLRGPDGQWQFRTPDAESQRPRAWVKVPPRMVEQFLGDRTCYFIRSYKVKRLDGTDQTVPDGVTTCTAGARFQLRRSAPRK